MTILVAISLSTSVSPAWAQMEQSDAKHELKLGETLYFNGNVAGAIRAYKAAQAMDPTLIRAHLDLLQLYMNTGDYNSAILESAEALKAEPANKKIWLVLASVLQNSTIRVDVSGVLQDAIAAGGDFPTAHFSLGMLQLDKKDYQGAADSFAIALKEQPQFPGAHLNLAIALGHMGKTHEALNEVVLAIQENSKYRQAYIVEGQLMARAERERYSAYDKLASN